MSGERAAVDLRERLLALIGLQQPAASAGPLADALLTRWQHEAPAGEPFETAIARLQQLTRQQLGPLAATAADAASPVTIEPDAATRKALRACFATLGTDAAKLILGYYEFGGDGGGQGARQRRRQQLATRLGVTPDALRDRALAARAGLEACVRARCADDGA
ncbi:hypothetical protein [Nevskia sp.]|uniref:hypothetical protein n=1 Tax=Nevskia sp. TaxID=1929292 RepID=UPI003F6EF4C4